MFLALSILSYDAEKHLHDQGIYKMVPGTKNGGVSCYEYCSSFSAFPGSTQILNRPRSIIDMVMMGHFIEFRDGCRFLIWLSQWKFFLYT